MGSSVIKSGALVLLQELNPSSPFFEQGASLRVTGKFVVTCECDRVGRNNTNQIFLSDLIRLLVVAVQSKIFVTENSLELSSNLHVLQYRLEEYSPETAIATIVDGDAKLKINTEHLREVSFRLGSIYQFIGELLIRPDNEAILQARVGRNVDGINLTLYHQSVQLLRQFQADRLKSPAI